VKFGFVVKHRAAWPVPVLCEALGVSRSGFYAWIRRAPSPRARRHAIVGPLVRASFVAGGRTYGARKVWHDVLEAGHRCGLHQVEHLMRTQALLHHSDRGSQYTSDSFQRLLRDLGVTCSMSRSGNVWDNSVMESFFSSLKIERTRPKTYRTRNEVRADVFDDIERFYNPIRRHATLGYVRPIRYEAQARAA
jgi:putative transposase